mgnify:CR=1 FL=1|tara:strand:- start:259 stop:465 length:207 start_codon:yes stop_codon:yes gene_type:complete
MNSIREILNKDKIRIALQIIVAAMIGLEVSIPPNPYKQELIIALVVLICVKHDIPNKFINKMWSNPLE